MCTIAYMQAQNIEEKTLKYSTFRSPRQVSAVDKIMGGQHIRSEELQKKILFEFEPFMEGYHKFRSLLERAKRMNLLIYDILDNQIGASYYNLKSKQIKREEFEECLAKGLKDLKAQLSKEDMIKVLDSLKQENDINTLTQALTFSQLSYEERKQVEAYYLSVINNFNITLKNSHDDVALSHRLEALQKQNKQLQEELERVIAHNHEEVEKAHSLNQLYLREVEALR